jgi:hypothetical protein
MVVNLHQDKHSRQFVRGREWHGVIDSGGRRWRFVRSVNADDWVFTVSDGQPRPAFRDAELTLRSGTDNYLAHINIGWLLDRERNSTGYRMRRQRELVPGVDELGFLPPDLSRCPRSSSGRSPAK